MIDTRCTCGSDNQQTDVDEGFSGRLHFYVYCADCYDGAPIDWETPSDSILGHGYTEREAFDDWYSQTLDEREST